MRFLSKFRNLYFGPIIPEKRMLLASGDWDQIRDTVGCQFEHAAATPEEIEIAFKHFSSNGQFAGTTMDEDEVTPEDPRNRISAFDTVEAQHRNGWTDEVREQVEQTLLNHPTHGYDYIVVEQARLAPPWPAYDKLVKQGARTDELIAQKIVETVTALEMDPGAVIAYERQNKDRPAVIEALSAVGAPDPEEELVSA